MYKVWLKCNFVNLVFVLMNVTLNNKCCENNLNVSILSWIMLCVNLQLWDCNLMDVFNLRYCLIYEPCIWELMNFSSLLHSLKCFFQLGKVFQHCIFYYYTSTSNSWKIRKTKTMTFSSVFSYNFKQYIYIYNMNCFICLINELIIMFKLNLILIFWY